MRRWWGLLTLCLIAATVLPAAGARAHPVLLHNRCEGARFEALIEQLRVVEAEVRYREGPVPSSPHIRQWLTAQAGGVVVLVDPACEAEVHGANGEHYEVSAQLPTRSWAVRIAELAYALSPYHVQPAETEEIPADVAAESGAAPQSVVAPPEARTRAWSLGMGPAWWRVSGSDRSMAALGLQLAWRAHRYVSLTMNGIGALSRTGIGASERRALVRMIRFGIGPRLTLPLTEALSADLSLTYSALWLHADGRARPPLGNRGDHTWGSMASAALGAAYRASPVWSVRFEASVGRALPSVRVVLGDREHELGELASSLYAALQLHF